MEYQTLRTEQRGHTLVVTLHRPEKLNALNSQARADLKGLFSEVAFDADVHAVVITGAGEKAFVAGADIQELATLDAARGKEFAAQGQAIFDAIEQLGKPVIAAVNGYALGGGCELALACHIRIASENARFGQPEVNLGLIPGYGGTQRLARLIGRGKALEMILTGAPVDAHEALRVGLVNVVVPQAELIDTAVRMADLVGSRGNHATRGALKAVLATEQTSLAEGQKLEAQLFGDCCGSDDFKEGTQAFLEKRAAVFNKK